MDAGHPPTCDHRPDLAGRGPRSLGAGGPLRGLGPYQRLVRLLQGALEAMRRSSPGAQGIRRAHARRAPQLQACARRIASDLLADLGHVETTMLKPDGRILSARLDPQARTNLECWIVKRACLSMNEYVAPCQRPVRLAQSGGQPPR